MQNNKWIPISIISLAFSIIFSSVFIGYSIQKTPKLESNPTNLDVMDLEEVANYLGMTKFDVERIIKIEKIF